VDVEEVELFAARDLGLFDGERERVVRRFEERVVERRDLVELDLVRDVGEPGRTRAR
jgi:hypothetical protein